MNRQCILAKDAPPRVTSILDEAVLRRMIGGPEVMREQLRKVAELAAHPAVTIQVLPLSTTRIHPSPEGPFTIFTMPDPYVTIAYVETRGGGVYVESPKADDFLRAYTHIRQAALTPEESAALISAAAERIM